MLSHMTFIVRNLDRMEEIVTKVLKGRKVYDSGRQTFSIAPERFFLIGEGEAAVWFVTMEGEVSLDRSYNHIAFKIDETELDERLCAIERLGLQRKEGRPRIPGEAYSIYFYDDDNHLFELHTGTLEERLRSYAEHSR